MELQHEIAQLRDETEIQGEKISELSATIDRLTRENAALRRKLAAAERRAQSAGGALCLMQTYGSTF